MPRVPGRKGHPYPEAEGGGMAAFSIGAKAYAGMGFTSSNGSPVNDLWEYDPSADTWTQKANFGGTARARGVSFTIGSLGYVGLGSDYNNYLADLWEYNPSSNAWTKKADFPGNTRTDAFSFVIDTKAYIGTGFAGQTIRESEDFWEYNSANNTWTQLTNFPGGKSAMASGFSINAKGYAVDLNGKQNWEYDPASAIWTRKADFPGEYSNAAAFAINNEAFIASRKKTWNYTPTSNQWQQVTPFGGLDMNYAAGFAIGNKGYVVGGDMVSLYGKEKRLWEYDPSTTILSPPTGLTAQAISQTEIKLIWTDNATDETNYKIIRHTGTDTFVEVATLGPNTTTYTESGLTPNILYYYYIRVCGASCTGGFSNLTSATTPSLPTAPSSLVATPYSKTSIYLTWSDKANNEASLIMERSTGNNASFEEFKNLAADTESYLDENVTEGTTYFYRIKARNDQGDSDYSNESSASPEYVTLGAWSKLTNFPSIGLSDAVSFVIDGKGYVGVGYGNGTGTNKKDFWEYDPTTGAWTQKADYGGATRTYAVAFAIGNYGYIGTGSNYLDFWKYDKAANTWTAIADFPTVSGSPFGFTGFTLNDKGYVLAGKKLYHYDPGTNLWTSKADLPGNGLIYASSFVLNSKGYIITGLYTGNTGEKTFYEYDPVANSWIQKTDFPGQARYGAYAFAINGKGYLGFGKSGSQNVNDFWEYNPSTDGWKRINGINQGVLSNGEAFAIGSKGYITLSFGTEVWSFNPSVPNSPTNLDGTPVSQTKISVTWKDNSNDEAKFILERSTSSTGSFSLVTEVAANSTAYEDNTLSAYTTYYYRIKAQNASGDSQYSNTVNATTLPNPPTAPTVYTPGTVNSTKFTLSWMHMNGVATYYIDISTDEFATFIPGYENKSVSYTAASGYVVSNLQPEKTYKLRMRAENVAGLSPNSTPISVTTALTPPTELSASSVTPGTIKLQWQDNTEAETGYRVERSVNNTNIFTALTTLAANSTSFEDATASADSKYFYRIIATGSRNSDPSITNFITRDGMWTKKADMPITTVRSGATAFSVNGKGYVGLGTEIFDLKDLWEYDPAADTWTQKADFEGEGRLGAVAFAIGSAAYVGTGSDDNYNNLKDFWKFDPIANDWIQLADFPGTARRGAIGLSINGKGYLGTGNSSSETSDWWEYTPATDTWAQKADFAGGATAYAAGFSIEGSGYIVSKKTLSPFESVTEVWQYNPEVDTWIQKSDFPGSTRTYASAFSIASKGYLVAGQNTGTRYKDLWEYDASLDQWTRRADFASLPRSEAASFSIGLKGYIATGYDDNTTEVYTRDIWEFDPFIGLPLKPENLVVSITPENTVSVTWEDKSDNETNFSIERSADTNTSFTLFTSTPADATSFEDATIEFGKSYYYRVYASNDMGDSPFTEEVRIDVPAKPSAPTELTSALIGELQVQLNWKDNNTERTQFVIERSLSQDTGFTPIEELEATSAQEYVDTDVDYDLKYFYRIKTLNNGVSSDYSNISSVEIPTGVSESPRVAIFSEGKNVHIHSSASQSENQQVVIFNISGKQIINTNLTERHSQFSLGKESAGVYLVKVQYGNRLEVKKILIQ